MKKQAYSMEGPVKERALSSLNGSTILISFLTALFYAIEDISIFCVRARRFASYGYHRALEAGARAGFSHRRSVLVFCLACFSTVVLTAFCVSFTVSLDGLELGAISSQAEFSEAVLSVEASVSEALGREYDVNSRVSYQLSLSSGNNVYDAGDYENMLLSGIPEVTRLHVISVDGAAAGGSKNRAELSTELSELLSYYSNESTVSAHFVEEVGITYTLADARLLQSAEEIVESLTSNTAEAASLLTVETVDLAAFTEEVAFETEYIYDDNMYSDEFETLRDGVNGEAIVSYEITYHNGSESSRAETGRELTILPVSMQIVTGTQERPTTASKGYFIWPTEGTISSYFGYRDTTVGSANHTGIDICNSYGTQICAADGGEVIYAGWMSGYGNLVQIRHDNGYVTYYAHCSRLDVSVGDLVYQGQLIARMGSTGTSTTNHLHFEVRINGAAYNGLKFLP